MTLSFLISVVLAAGLGVLCAALYLNWPRRMTAEEWVLHRRSMVEAPAARSAGVSAPHQHRPRYRRWGRVMESLTTLDADLAILALGTGEPALTGAAVVARLIRVAVGGAAVGFVAALGLWFLLGADGLPMLATPVGIAVGLLTGAMSWRRVRRHAAVMRGAVERRLPRILTGTRMLLESGAATPERALAVAVSLYDDPAADLMREALRYREVNRVPIEAGLEAVASMYGVQQLNRLADAFRVSGRYGTQLADTIARFAAELRRVSHTDYRERMTRAPVLMTVPALIFFVAPLLVLVLYLVFAPLGSVLSQL